MNAKKSNDDGDLRKAHLSVDAEDAENAKFLIVRLYVTFPDSKKNDNATRRLFARAFELVGRIGKKAGAIGFAEVIRELIRILRE